MITKLLYTKKCVIYKGEGERKTKLILSSIVTMIVNLILFSIIPFIWWLIRHRKKESFFTWLGFIKPKLKSKWWVLLIFGVVYYFFYNFDFTTLLSPETMKALEESGSVAVHEYKGLGVAAIIPALITNFIANGVAEEILYRGFLCKRLCGKLGTTKGVILQAVLFALMHNALYLLAGVPVGVDYHALMFVFTGTGALLLAYLNEKIYNGSIIPSIIMHGLGNFITSMLVAFNL